MSISKLRLPMPWRSTSGRWRSSVCGGLGLFSEEPLPGALVTPVDILTHRMLEKLAYGEGERDMVAIQHRFRAQYPDRAERITSTMVDFGISLGGDSSMSRTVGASLRGCGPTRAEGKFHKPGVVVPVIAELYEPVLDELARLGISVTESVELLPAGNRRQPSALQRKKKVQRRKEDTWRVVEYFSDCARVGAQQGLIGKGIVAALDETRSVW